MNKGDLSIRIEDHISKQTWSVNDDDGCVSFASSGYLEAMYLEQKDSEYALRDMYRLNVTYQALADEVYVGAMFRLAHMESKLVSSMCYQTANHTPGGLDYLNRTLWSHFLGAKQREIAGAIVNGREYLKDFEPSIKVMISLTFTNAVLGIKHILLDAKGITSFVYSKEFYNESQTSNFDTSPMTRHDYQFYHDFVHSLTKESH